MQDQTPDIAIIDPCCQRGYGPSALQDGALGGTEATVLRVAAGLSAQMRFVHYQNRRTAAQMTVAGRFHPLEQLPDQPPAPVVIVLNSWKLACKLRKAYPDTPIALWLHIYPGRHNRGMGRALSDADIPIICVSNSQARWLRGFLTPGPVPQLHVAYNPIGDELMPDSTHRDPNRLLFASSPHKGLRQVFEQFTDVRRFLPGLSLTVADPGYLAWETGPVPDNVHLLGAIPHHQLISQMRSSLCLFYPQSSFAETFGLVMAEANAVGTPVLVQRGLGANDEVVGDPAQLLDGFDAETVARRLHRWQTQSPRIELDNQFRTSAVCRSWLAIFSRIMADRHQREVA